MIKSDAVKALAKGEGCLGRSQDDEPVFILVARDRTSSKTVRQWVQNARDAGCANETKLSEALSGRGQVTISPETSRGLNARACVWGHSDDAAPI